MDLFLGLHLHFCPDFRPCRQVKGWQGLLAEVEIGRQANSIGGRIHETKYKYVSKYIHTYIYICI